MSPRPVLLYVLRDFAAAFALSLTYQLAKRRLHDALDAATAAEFDNEHEDLVHDGGLLVVVPYERRQLCLCSRCRESRVEYVADA